MKPIRLAVSLIVICGVAGVGLPADWPMWRHDAERSAATDEKLPAELHLQWVRQYPKLKPAWPQQVAKGFMTFDVSYKPIVMGKRLYVGSSLNHRLTALDTATGDEVWRFYAGGPIRLAPVGWKDKVYFVSDDGYLYCLGAGDGKLKWRLRAGPDNRKVIGNGHLVSLWPARGGPVLADGKIYFGASIWPFVGSFLYAVDAETGKVIWCNSGIGAAFRPSFSYQGSGLLVRPGMFGSVPQGYLVVARDRLGVPQGRNVAQLFDRKTGELLFNEMYGMHVRHDSSDYWFALTAGGSVFSGRPGSAGVSVETARMSHRNPIGDGITGRKTIYHVSGGAISARSTAAPYKAMWSFRLATPAATRGPDTYIKAGDNLYAPGAGNKLLIVKDVDTDKRTLIVGPEIPGGEVRSMLAADGRLFVVTIDGQIACYGAGKGKAKSHPYLKAELPVRKDGIARRGAEILKAAGQTGGYCLVLGLGDGKLAEALCVQSKLNVIAVDPDEKQLAVLRRRMDDAGFYGERFSALRAQGGDPPALGLPPYLVNLIVSERFDADILTDAKAAKDMFRILRPYGGVIYLRAGTADKNALAAAAEKAGLAGAVVTQVGSYVILKRKGPPPGAADWTHSNATAANTLATYDKLVKPPLGVLWFGGPPNTPILPRHGRGPAPTVVNGRLVIEGRNLLRCIDIYTGRLLWEAALPDLGRFYDTGAKQLGTHETGPNYACAPGGVYVITPAKCVQLDPATGKQVREFPLPGGVEKGSLWATVRVEGNLLVATIRPIDTKRKFAENARIGAGGKHLAVFSRKTGKELWARKATYGFRSSGVAVAADKVFCIDGLSAAEIEQAKRRNMDVSAKSAMYAFDAQTGKQLWKVDAEVFGTWLGYSAEHGVLVQAGCGRGAGEPTALAAHKAADGARIWRNPAANEPKGPSFTGPPILHHKVVIPQHGQVLGLLDGKGRTRAEPLTGRQVPWNAAAHGCGFVHAGEHMILQRAWSTGGYTLIETAPRVFGLGGFRSGCTANMVPAGGVLTAPDYTRDCECQFKNKTSLAMIHMPEMEHWSFEMGPPPVESRIRRLGLNFAAPGDRVSDTGTLWLDCPDVGGPSTPVAVALEPAKAGTRLNWLSSRGWRRGMERAQVFAGKKFHHHTTVMKGGPLKWVAGSGLIGVKSIKVTLVPAAAKKDRAAYTVNLYFAEPDAAAKAGDRVFAVSLQGKAVLADFDVVKEARGTRRTVIKRFEDIRAGDTLDVAFTPAKGEPLICGLEIIMQE